MSVAAGDPAVTVAVDANGADLGPAEVAAGATMAAASADAMMYRAFMKDSFLVDDVVSDAITAFCRHRKDSAEWCERLRWRSDERRGPPR